MHEDDDVNSTEEEIPIFATAPASSFLQLSSMPNRARNPRAGVLVTLDMQTAVWPVNTGHPEQRRTSCLSHVACRLAECETLIGTADRAPANTQLPPFCCRTCELLMLSASFCPTSSSYCLYCCHWKRQWLLAAPLDLPQGSWISQAAPLARGTP